MKAAEVHAPLAAAAPRAPIAIRVPLPIALAFATVLIGGPMVWLGVVDDPLGGEPRGSARIAAPVERSGGAPAEPNAARATDTRAPEGRPTVSIISPGPNGQMTVRRVEVPPEEPAGAAPAARTPPAATATRAPQRRATRPVPDPDLLERTDTGLLPRIGPDGTRPWRAYAQATPAPRQGATRIALLVSGVGLAAGTTEAALTRLPPEIGVAFSPYAANLSALFERTRVNQREVFLQVPMEPFDFPASDPGPQTLLAGANAEQNRARLNWALARASGYVGVVNLMGARFTATASALRPVLDQLRQRGVAIIDDGASHRSVVADLARDLGVAHARATGLLDGTPTPDAIDEALLELERRAAAAGGAIGVIQALPISVERVVRWSRDLDRRGIQLVPVSALITPDRADAPAPAPAAAR